MVAPLLSYCHRQLGRILGRNCSTLPSEHPPYILNASEWVRSICLEYGEPIGSCSKKPIKLFNIDKTIGQGVLHSVAVKHRDLTAEQMVSVECPTCGAGFGEPCELNSGSPRFEPHRDRKLAAADAVEAKLTRAELTTELRELRDQQLQSFSAATFAGWTPELKTAHRSDRIAELQRELRIVDKPAPACQFPGSSSAGNQQQQTRSIDQPQRARYTSPDVPE